MLFVANVDEGDDAVPAAIADARGRRRAPPRWRSPRGIEAELSELDDDEAAVMREELGVGESGLHARRRTAPSGCST